MSTGPPSQRPQDMVLPPIVVEPTSRLMAPPILMVLSTALGYARHDIDRVHRRIAARLAEELSESGGTVGHARDRLYVAGNTAAIDAGGIESDAAREGGGADDRLVLFQDAP